MSAMKTIFVVLLGTVLLGSRALADELITREEVKDREAVVSMNLKNDGKSPLRVVLHNPANSSSVTITCEGGKTALAYAPENAYAEERDRCSTQPSPALGGINFFTLKRTAQSWIAYVNDQPVAQLPELWTETIQVRHLPADKPDDKSADSYTQKLAPFDFHDGFMVPAGSAFPETWEKVSGTWSLHSVTGSISGSSGGYTLRRQPLPEKSPNFYIMQGSGTNAVLLTGEPFYSRYTYSASVQHNEGTNGIVFLAPERGGYYAFTAENSATEDGLILVLWQRPADAKAPPNRIAAVQTGLIHGQWLLMEVQVFDDRVRCFADHNLVIQQKLPLPPGGRFGLYADTPPNEITRFDDISVSSHEDIPLDSVADLAFFRNKTSQNPPKATEENGQAKLTFAAGVTNIWHFGNPTATALRNEVTFQPQAADFTIGLETGSPSGLPPCYRFLCSQAGEKRTFTMVRQEADGKTQELDRFEAKADKEPFTLALDGLRGHELRGYLNGQLVCITILPQQASAVQGVTVLSSGAVTASMPKVTSKETVLRDRFEKNPLYVNDPYMRHWSSPEGQWVTFPTGKTWFKGDLLGSVEIRLPVVDKMELHLCIPEGKEETGQCRVLVQGGVVKVFTPESGEAPAIQLPVDQIPMIEEDRARFQAYTLGISGHVVWIGSESAVLAKTHVANRMTGRRMRIAGMSNDRLAKTLVTRDNVFDTLFNESLYNWTINGGKWEVINRFYCEPTWSHMNGENPDSLAALWSKYNFSGDFSVEFYAGLRMGWYSRAGDLNMTVMSRSNSAGNGYTAIATGWDPDHSQLYSRLLRNNTELARSTKYLVPRIRSGNARRGYQPLVASGRPIHGAWYAMQLRRIGNHLSYVYDNEPVFEADDASPLQDGSLGIWTYQNSMMVARIKIAAENVRPRPFPYRAIDPNKIPKAKSLAVKDSGIRIKNRAAQWINPAFWEAEDSVGHPSIRYAGLDTTNAEMWVTSTLGAGTFFARNLQPAAPAGELLGWEFEMMQSQDAHVNAEFSTVKVDPKTGTNLMPYVQGWTYLISGDPESRGPRAIAGRSTTQLTNDNWRTVTVWLPSQVRKSPYHVQFEGFGNLAKGVQLPSDMTPGSSQAFLAALGAARAAMEGQG